MEWSAAVPPDEAALRAWAAEAQVPAYTVLLVPDRAAPATIRKVQPPGETFALMAQQFYSAVLRQIERQHRCGDN